MRIGAQLESSNACEGRIVEIGQGLNFSDFGKILCNSPYKTLLRQILAEIQNGPYYPRHLWRCKERRRDQREVQIELVIDDINRLKQHVFVYNSK
jgi:ribosomal protein S15P/S13E